MKSSTVHSYFTETGYHTLRIKNTDKNTHYNKYWNNKLPKKLSRCAPHSTIFLLYTSQRTFLPLKLKQWLQGILISHVLTESGVMGGVAAPEAPPPPPPGKKNKYHEQWLPGSEDRFFSQQPPPPPLWKTPGYNIVNISQ